MFSRAVRAAILDRRPFTEAFFDSNATADGAVLVAIVGGATYLLLLVVHGAIDRFSIGLLVSTVITAVVSWLLLGFATWFAATRLFGADARPQTMLGLQGLAALPLILDAFGEIASGLGLIWYLVILVMATREAASINTRLASVSVLIGFALVVVLRLILQVPFAIFGQLL